MTASVGDPPRGRVEIVEVGPRDGLQNEKRVLSTAVKAKYVRRCVGSGVRRVEVTSFVDPKRVPQMADAEELLAELGSLPDVTFSALVLNARGFERARRVGIREVNAVVVASDTFGQRNQGQTIHDAVAFFDELAVLARAAGVKPTVTVSAAFGCPFEGEVPTERIAEIAKMLAQAQPAEIILADTIGVGVPTQVTERVEAIRSEAPDIPLRCHFHNTRNTGYANAVAALQAGVRTFDASTGGIGGCPFAPRATGNIATEDLTYLLERMGYDTGVDLDAASSAGTWISEQLGITTPALLGRAGSFPPRA